MREYRGKRIDNGEWAYGDLIKNKDKYFIHPQANVFKVENSLAKIMVCHEVIPETVGQFTGLTDKNGKKIFEGDIVADCFGKPLGVVAFGEHYFDSGILKYTGFYYKSLSFWGDGNLYDDTNEEDWKRKQVIGNIYDNPELLKVVEK